MQRLFMKQRSLSTAVLAAMIAGILVAAGVMICLAEKAVEVLQTGLSRSASIRVAQASAQCETPNQDEPHFVGCSSIL